MKRRLALGGLLGALALGWWLARPAPVAPSTARLSVAHAPEPIAAPAARPKLTPAALTTPEIPVMAAGAEDSSANGPRHPHPITATRLRIYRENNLIGTMNRAMDRGRHQELRQLNAQYKDEFPEDEHRLQEAYDLIADCQEQLSDERQARAREFWTKHRSSQARRFLRRHCRL